MVLYCIEHNKYLLALTLEELKQFSEWFDNNTYKVLQPEQVIHARNVYGGTATVQVKAAIERTEQAIVQKVVWVEAREGSLKQK